MSLAFNDTATLKGLVQMYEKELGMNPGDVSGNATKLLAFTAEANIAFDDFLAIAIPSSGTWQYDDANFTDYPIVTGNIKSGQRDYSVLQDTDGNQILDIHKVLVADTTGYFVEIFPVDVQSNPDTQTFTDGRNTAGVPNRYDKTANGIFLDPIPNYDSAGGLKIYISREPSYFTAADTSKKPGIPGPFQKYLYLKPVYNAAARASMPIAGGRLRNGAYTGLLMQIKDLESQIAEYFSKRTRDEPRRLAVTTRDSNR